jgi:type I restriction enzyme S subunit
MKTIENGYKVPPAGIPQLTKPMLQDVKIPIPCPENPKKSLEIQAEIVRILDTFTELTTELTARKKQYNYYRDQLLSFEEGEVEWKPLGGTSKNLKIVKSTHYKSVR